MADQFPTDDRPSTGEARPRRSLKPLAALAPYVLRHKGMAAAALAFLVAAAATTLSLPVAVRRVVDHGFMAGGDAHFIDAYFAMLGVLVLVLALASAGRYFFVVTLGETVVAELRRDVFAHLARLSPSFFDRTMSGEIVSRLTADTVQIKSAFGASASILLRNLILFLGASAMMVVTSPSLSLLVLAAIPLVVLPLVALGRSVRRRARRAQDTLAEASAYATEAIGAIRTVQAFNAEGPAIRRFDAAVDDAFRAARDSIGARALLTAFAIFVVSASIVAVLWIGASRVAAGTLSPGTLGQFMLYAVFAAGALGQLSEVWGELAASAGAAERLGELLAERSAVAEPAAPTLLPVPAKGAVRFENVVFGYPGRPDAPALSGLSFEVRPGETVALVGPSGAGKSTVFALLERFYDPDAGRILVDGVDIRTVALADLRARLALVPQDVTVFAASASENIAFGAGEAPEADVRAAARAALADGFLARMPEGYATRLGERGVSLSGGQRQRIAIARAVLRDAPILLLDEATSALDAESEVMVQRALEGLMRDRTTLVIAHRLATVLKADRILVVEDGRIVEEGTHAALLGQGGLYARLARLQFHAGPLLPNAAE